MEDTQVILTLNENDIWVGTIADALSGRTLAVECTPDEATAIFALMVHHDGMPHGVDEFYKDLQPWLDRYDMGPNGRNVALRPVP